MNIWDHIPYHPVNPSEEIVKAFGPLQVDESKFLPEMEGKFPICKKRGGGVSEHLRNWLAEIKAMDDEIGRLLNRLDELGLRDNTIVVFSSDQGPEDIRDPEMAKAGEFAAIRDLQKWRECVRAYLACIAFTDAQVGCLRKIVAQGQHHHLPVERPRLASRREGALAGADSAKSASSPPAGAACAKADPAKPAASSADRRALA